MIALERDTTSLIGTWLDSGVVEVTAICTAIAVLASFIIVLVRNATGDSEGLGNAFGDTLSGIIHTDSSSAFEDEGIINAAARFVFYALSILPLVLILTAIVLLAMLALLSGLQGDATVGQHEAVANFNPDDSRNFVLILALSALVAFGLAAWMERKLDWVVHVLNVTFTIVVGIAGASTGLAIARAAGWTSAPGWAMPTASVLLALATALLTLFYFSGFVPERWKDTIAPGDGYFNPLRALWKLAKTLFIWGIVAGSILFIIGPALG